MISCQIGFYPLRDAEVGAAVDEALAMIRDAGLATEIGTMSTVVAGPTDEVYALLAGLTAAMERRGREFVMTMTVSTSCPMPGTRPAARSGEDTG